MESLIFLFFLALIVFAISFALVAFRRLNSWNKTYDRLAVRYGGKKGKGGVNYGFGVKRPSLSFDYGRTFCTVKNRKSFFFSNSKSRTTEIAMIWPNRKLRFEISTDPARSRVLGRTLRQVAVEDPQFQSDFYVSSNDPALVKKMLNNSVQWQIEQLRRHMGNNKVQVTLNRGSLIISKPGFIKDFTKLEDFVRFSLELFDQLMLIDAKGIEFVNPNEASVVDQVKCPICSEEIMHNMVVCSRCKTPHCQDCWHYNGQCATFACSETRCIVSGAVDVDGTSAI